MDLRGIANGATNTVNPNINVTVTRSTGSTTGAGYKRTPSYAEPVTGPAQIQPLSTTDLKQVEGLNIQGVMVAIYLRGPLAGVVRATGQGGDLVTITTAPYVGTWYIGKILEAWPNWTKAVIVLQVS